MAVPNIRPPAIKLGDTIGVIAPAGPIQSIELFHEGIAILQRLGFRPRFSERIFQSSRYLAGDDRSRAEELMTAFENPEINAIMPVRGGYGCARLLPYLDQERLKNHCKLFMGFSDLTTLHLLFRKQFGWSTLHGPMVASLPAGVHSQKQEEHLVSLWTNPHYLPKLEFPQLVPWHDGIAEGELVGGCLSILVASLGTPYEIRTEGTILLLEDRGEPPYRLDRMVTQLLLAQKLDSVSGILLGTFHDCDPTQGDYSAEDILRERFAQLKIPILSGFPAGHGEEHWTLPLGVKVRLDADNSALELLEPAVF
jgi:muramoyltetrapeptide carboxypeptidase